jgi:hypothetical protein
MERPLVEPDDWSRLRVQQMIEDLSHDRLVDPIHGPAARPRQPAHP